MHQAHSKCPHDKTFPAQAVDEDVSRILDSVTQLGNLFLIHPS